MPALLSSIALLSNGRFDKLHADDGRSSNFFGNIQQYEFHDLCIMATKRLNEVETVTTIGSRRHLIASHVTCSSLLDAV